MIDSNFYKSITFILSGSLLYQFTGTSGGWASGVACAIGFIIFYKGLNMLQKTTFGSSQKGVSLMKIAALIGAIGGLADVIPVMGTYIASTAYVIAFVLMIVGLIKFRSSYSLGSKGKQGVLYILIGMGLSIVASIFGVIPFVGSGIAGIFALVALLLSFSGWFKIQDGLMETASISQERNLV